MAVNSIISVEDLINYRDTISGTVGFVPTMGAMHDGHKSLIEKSLQECDHSIVSIFVNPMQFGANEDFSKYPRTLKADIELISKLGADVVFLPNAASIYPQNFQTCISNTAIGLELDGKDRPGHFEGVLTVVMKLFNIVRPTKCYFGKKDYQQLFLIRKMCEDMLLSVEVVGCETIREQSGLAMSSRNVYLSDQERAAAESINVALNEAVAKFESGEKIVEDLISHVREKISNEIEVQYICVRNQEDLMEIELGVVESPSVILFAGKIGSTRLLDNMELK